jgi:undecaprenyl pyrophosphate synthase
MITLILKIDNAINASKIKDEVMLFKGVKQAHLVTENKEKSILKAKSKTTEKEDIGLLIAIKEGRTGKFVTTEDFIQKLRK